MQNGLDVVRWMIVFPNSITDDVGYLPNLIQINNCKESFSYIINLTENK
jgi:hypothetical protein